MSGERLLGFDGRKTWLDPAAQWPVDRRTAFLLREDAEPVLSVDEFVWPSVFATDQWPVATRSEIEEHGLTGPERPGWIGPNRPLWEKLDELRAHLEQEAAGVRRSYWIVAITVIDADQEERPPGHGPERGRVDPGDVDPEWTLLGYDVADGSLVSGLTNCGYPRGQKEDTRRLWAEHLNPYHLFDSAAVADGFRRDADRRVPEHEPFWVYGLYRIEEI